MLRNRILYALILIAVIALFIFYHNFFFFYLLLITAILPILSVNVSRYVWKNTEAQITTSVSSIGCKNDIPVEFIIDNKTVFPMPALKLSFKTENNFYPNEESQQVTLPLRKGTNKYGWSINSIYAGRVSFTGEKINMPDYFGLVVFEKEWDYESNINVMPLQSDVIMNVIESTLTEGDDQENDSCNSVDDVTQVKEFREYIPGDRIQKVNWKISAKHDNLYVKVFEQEYNRTLTLLVELRRDSEEVGFLDELLTAFYSAALKLMDMEIRFRIQWYDAATDRFMTESISDPDSLDDAIHQMYMMESYKEFYAFEKYEESEHGKYDMAVYFTSPSFDGYDEAKRIGTFKERVALICL